MAMIPMVPEAIGYDREGALRYTGVRAEILDEFVRSGEVVPIEVEGRTMYLASELSKAVNRLFEAP